MRAVRLAAPILALALAGCERPPPREPLPDLGAMAESVAVAERVAREDEGWQRIVIDSGAEYREMPHRPDDCHYVGPRREVRYAARYDSTVMRNGIPFRCRLRPRGPEVRVVLGGEGSIPLGFHVYAPAEAARPSQTFALDNSEGAYEGADLLTGEDLNGDGWMDLRVKTYSGSGGVMYDVFRYSPSANGFVQDSVLSGATNVMRIAGRPCAGTSAKTSVDDVTEYDHCWSGGAWVLTRVEAHARMRGGLLHTVQERRGGRLQVVSVDTIRTGTP
jgi:hypothetical protein